MPPGAARSTVDAVARPRRAEKSSASQRTVQAERFGDRYRRRTASTRLSRARRPCRTRLAARQVRRRTCRSRAPSRRSLPGPAVEAGEDVARRSCDLVVAGTGRDGGARRDPFRTGLAENRCGQVDAVRTPGRLRTTSRTTSAQAERRRRRPAGRSPSSGPPAQATTIASAPSLSTLECPLRRVVADRRARRRAVDGVTAAASRRTTRARMLLASHRAVRTPVSGVCGFWLADRPQEEAALERHFAQELARALAQLGRERPADVAATRALARLVAVARLPDERPRLAAPETLDRDGFHNQVCRRRVGPGVPWNEGSPRGLPAGG